MEPFVAPNRPVFQERPYSNVQVPQGAAGDFSGLIQLGRGIAQTGQVIAELDRRRDFDQYLEKKKSLREASIYADTYLTTESDEQLQAADKNSREALWQQKFSQKLEENGGAKFEELGETSRKKYEMELQGAIASGTRTWRMQDSQGRQIKRTQLLAEEVSVAQISGIEDAMDAFELGRAKIQEAPGVDRKSVEHALQESFIISRQRATGDSEILDPKSFSIVASWMRDRGFSDAQVRRAIGANEPNPSNVRSAVARYITSIRETGEVGDNGVHAVSLIQTLPEGEPARETLFADLAKTSAVPALRQFISDGNGNREHLEQLRISLTSGDEETLRKVIDNVVLPSVGVDPSKTEVSKSVREEMRKAMLSEVDTQLEQLQTAPLKTVTGEPTMRSSEAAVLVALQVGDTEDVKKAITTYQVDAQALLQEKKGLSPEEARIAASRAFPQTITQPLLSSMTSSDPDIQAKGIEQFLELSDRINDPAFSLAMAEQAAQVNTPQSRALAAQLVIAPQFFSNKRITPAQKSAYITWMSDSVLRRTRSAAKIDQATKEGRIPESRIRNALEKVTVSTEASVGRFLDTGAIEGYSTSGSVGSYIDAFAFSARMNGLDQSSPVYNAIISGMREDLIARAAEASQSGLFSDRDIINAAKDMIGAFERMGMISVDSTSPNGRQITSLFTLPVNQEGVFELSKESSYRNSKELREVLQQTLKLPQVMFEQDATDYYAFEGPQGFLPMMALRARLAVKSVRILTDIDAYNITKPIRSALGLGNRLSAKLNRDLLSQGVTSEEELKQLFGLGNVMEQRARDTTTAAFYNGQVILLQEGAELPGTFGPGVQSDTRGYAVTTAMTQAQTMAAIDTINKVGRISGRWSWLIGRDMTPVRGRPYAIESSDEIDLAPYAYNRLSYYEGLFGEE